MLIYKEYACISLVRPSLLIVMLWESENAGDQSTRHSVLSDAVENDPVPTPEKIHGKYEEVFLYGDTYAKMSQVRGEKNRVNEELKNSIEREGLLNPIDVARMNEASLQAYIEFVNGVWGSKTVIGDFASKREDDGTYYVVIAGHSRHQAIIDLESEGRIPPMRIAAKVHNVHSPEEIIAIQLAENIHSQPPRERRAIAIVETYEWGVRAGKWKTQSEFVSGSDNISKTFLSEALSFSHLPPQVRSFVLGGHISYNAGVALGKASQDAKEHIVYKAGIKTQDERKEFQTALDEVLLTRLVVKTNHILKGKFNSVASEKYINAWRNQMRREMQSDEEQSKTELAPMFNIDFITPEEQLQEQLALDRKAIAQFLQEFAQRPTSIAGEFIALSAEFVDDETIKKINEDFEKATKIAQLKVGAIIAQRTTKLAYNSESDEGNDNWGPWGSDDPWNLPTQSFS